VVGILKKKLVEWV